MGLATGLQDKFSFKNVALAALGGALQGVNVASNLGGATNLGNDVARGALGSAITQGIGVATGLQSKFDFVGVAAAGVGAGVGGAVGRGLKLASFDVSRSAANVAGTALAGTASAIANAATRSAVEGTNFGDNVMRALPDAIGSTIGSLLGSALQGPSQVALAKALENPVGQNNLTTQDKAKQYIDSLSATKRDYLTSKGIELVATPDGVKVLGLGNAQGAIASDSAAGIVRSGMDTAFQPVDWGSEFIDTAPDFYQVGLGDEGGLTFSYDDGLRGGRATSQWLAVGGEGALRFVSRGADTYLFEGSTQRFDALGLTLSYGSRPDARSGIVITGQAPQLASSARGTMRELVDSNYRVAHLNPPGDGNSGAMIGILASPERAEGWRRRP